MAKDDNLIKVIGIYNGHTIKRNFDVELKVRFNTEQLPNALQFVAVIGKQVILKAKIEKNVQHLGTFNLNSLKIDRNGMAFISFMSNSDYVSLEGIEKLLVDEVEILFVGKITQVNNSSD